MVNHLDLAVFGAMPAFAEKLHVGRPNVGDQERFIDRVREIFARRWLTNNGPCVQEFEHRIAETVGVKHCVAMCNATVALEIGIRALGMKGEVILPSFTFIATAHALQWQGITPVFCDIDARTHTLDPEKVEQAITPRTTGIIPVHVWGRACEIDELSEIARRHNLKLLFDSAHAFACSYRGRMIGGFGDAEVFSFHATKFFNTFEGGAVTTNDDELAKRIRLMKNFGFTNLDEVSYIGINGKMTEVSAAMGLTSLESLDTFIETNRANYKCYREGLASVPGVKIISYEEGERRNYQYIVIEVDSELTKIARDDLVQALWAENVFARRYFYPGCHRMQPYKSLFLNARFALPETEGLAERVICLPTGTAVTEDKIRQICEIIRIIVENGELVSREMHLRDEHSAFAESVV